MSTIVDILRETEEVQPIPGRKWARALRQEQLQEQRRHGPVWSSPFVIERVRPARTTGPSRRYLRLRRRG